MPFPFPFYPTYVFGRQAPDPGLTTIKRDPCPACKGTDYVFKAHNLYCVGCDRTKEHAERLVRTTAQRDVNGSLLCQKCGEPYPFAEPDDQGGFVCYSCRL